MLLGCRHLLRKPAPDELLGINGRLAGEVEGRISREAPQALRLLVEGLQLAILEVPLRTNGQDNLFPGRMTKQKASH